MCIKCMWLYYRTNHLEYLGWSDQKWMKSIQVYHDLISRDTKIKFKIRNLSFLYIEKKIVGDQSYSTFAGFNLGWSV